MPLRSLLFGLVATLAFAEPALAQIGYLWSFDELREKSDVVAVVALVGTEDTGRKIWSNDVRSGLPVVELSTTLDVLVVLKAGTPTTHAPAVVAGGRIALRHFKHDTERGIGGGIVNAGSELSFGPRGSVYIVFLKRASDGVLEPVSGQVFPDYSVFRLQTLYGQDPRLERPRRTSR